MNKSNSTTRTAEGRGRGPSAVNIGRYLRRLMANVEIYNRRHLRAVTIRSMLDLERDSTASSACYQLRDIRCRLASTLKRRGADNFIFQVSA